MRRQHALTLVWSRGSFNHHVLPEPDWLYPLSLVLRDYTAIDAQRHVRAVYGSLVERNPRVADEYSVVLGEVAQVIEDLSERLRFMTLARRLRQGR